MQLPTYNRQHYEAAGILESQLAELCRGDLEYPACAWCESPPESVFRIMDSIFGGPFHLVECRRCGLRFVWPRPTEAWTRAQLPQTSEAINTWIENHKLESPSEWTIAFYKRILGVLKTLMLGHDGLVLTDVGCGLGHFAKIADALGWDVQGCDWNEGATEAARRSYPDKDIFGSYSFIEFVGEHPYPEDIPHDVITMLDYLEHSYAPFRDLRTAAEGLRPTGLLVVKTFLDERDHEHKMLAPPVHLYHFTEDVLLRMIEDAGFTKPIVMYDGPGGVMVTVIAERL